MPRHAASRFVAAIAVLALACASNATGPEGELAAGRTRWARAGSTSYTMTINRTCECLLEMGGSVVIVVRNGVVESRHYVQSGTAVAPEYAELFPTVEGLFALIGTAVRDGTLPLDAQYHPTLGYPTRFAVGDPAVDAPVYTVTELRLR